MYYLIVEMAVHCCPVPLAERPWLTTRVFTLRGWLSGFEEGTPVKRTCSCFFSSQFLRTNMWPTGAKYKWMVPFSSATCVHYCVCSVCTVRALHRSHTLSVQTCYSLWGIVHNSNKGEPWSCHDFSQPHWQSLYLCCCLYSTCPVYVNWNACLYVSCVLSQVFCLSNVTVHNDMSVHVNAEGHLEGTPSHTGSCQSWRLVWLSQIPQW